MPSTTHYRATRLALTLLCALGLAACAGLRPGPVDSDELPELPEQFSVSGEQSLPDRWWRHFDDAALNAVVGRALSENFSLQAARERLRQAEAAARGAGAARAPELNATGGSSARRGSDGVSSENWALGAAASYEVDLWGRLESAADAARLDAEATRSQLEAAAISLSAQTASTFYLLLEGRGAQALLQSQARTNRQVLEIVELRFRNGSASADEVLRQQQLVEQTEAGLVSAAAQLELLGHSLAVLSGQPPRALAVPVEDALVEVPPLPAGVPSQWLQRRPDLREAFQRLKAADARLASAVAAQYPRINLSATLESAASSPSDVFSGWLSSIGGNLIAPLFDGGRRRAAVAQADAARAAALQDYGQTILAALREVEDALLAERRDRELLSRLEERAERAERIVSQLRMRYINGTANYLDVLSALDSQQNLARELLNARWVLVQDRIALARALAGGWDETAGRTPLIDSDLRAEQNDS